MSQRNLCFLGISFAVLAGAWFVPEPYTSTVVVRCGYPAAMLSLAWLVAAALRPASDGLIRHWKLLLLALPATIALHSFQPHEFKVEPDEYVIANTARSIGSRGASVVTVELWRGEGKRFETSDLIDKRPLAFPSIVAAIQTFSGYSPRTTVHVNVALSFGLIWLTVLLGYEFAGVAGALLGALFWPALPVAHYAFTSGGNDTFALFALLIVLHATKRLAGTASPANLSLFLAAVVVYCQTRPEAPLLALPFAFAAVWACRRSLPTIPSYVWAAPLLLVPTVLVRAITSGDSWGAELALNGVAQRFGFSYVGPNVREMARFVFSWDRSCPNSAAVCLAALLLSGLAGLAVRRGRTEPRVAVAVAGVLAAFLFTATSMAYFFGQWTDLVVVRTTLPFFLGVFLVIATAAGELPTKLRYTVAGFLLACAFWSHPQFSGQRYLPETQRLTRAIDELQQRSPADSLWITGNPMQAIVNGRCAIMGERANASTAALKAALAGKRYSHIYAVRWFKRNGDVASAIDAPLDAAFSLAIQRRLGTENWGVEIAEVR